MTTSSVRNDFAGLSRRISDAGLTDRRPGYYVLRFALVGGAYIGAFCGVVALGDSWWQLAIAAFLAVVFAQVALLAHDVAHRQVFRRRSTCMGVGRLIGNVGIGMSYSWWMEKHTAHHANPNHTDHDPDVEADLLVWSQKQARAATGVPAWFGRHQAFLFFPVLLLEGFYLHYAGFRACVTRKTPGRGIELALLSAHVLLYVALVFGVMPFWQAVAFVLVHQMLWGLYMGSTFAPNHKGMPLVDADDEPMDFLRKQVLTSRNISGGHVVDIAYGGLNHQIEHHLFPAMPSVNLRRAQPIVQAYCAEIGVDYLRTGLVDSYSQTLRSLYDAGAPLREQAAAVPSGEWTSRV
ncbi:fatty acid desaturase [Pseudonocardia sediminis]|uniref:Fatty acid desaturase n=1 Tax=Pseudonocardia sediminis TaxID=1397368 RepID=A0A4V2FQY3_PSEST|nr:acyl-CoA desaturase [Pseudonocardia sediminis]RZT86500.1 fatty acid desaturase [Pseudonocardia sediminis]